MLSLIEWTASLSGMFAAILVAWNAGARITGTGFIVFSASSVLWITASVLDGNSPLAIQNLVLLFINCLGIYRYLIRAPEQEG